MSDNPRPPGFVCYFCGKQILHFEGTIKTYNPGLMMCVYCVAELGKQALRNMLAKEQKDNIGEVCRHDRE